MKTENKKNNKTGFIIIGAFLVVLISMLFVTCKKDDEPEGCLTRIKKNQYFGYQVWAGDSALWKNNDAYFFYNIDKYYTLIDSATTTKTFNTGSFKYYVIVARYYACIDAIQFNDSSYYNYGQGYTLIGGLAEHPAGGVWAHTSARFLGPPDGISGNLGYKDLCPPGSFMAFITDNATITSRGGGLTVYVVGGCE